MRQKETPHVNEGHEETSDYYTLFSPCPQKNQADFEVRMEHPALPTPPEPKQSAWIKGNVGRMINENPPPVRWLVKGLIPAGAPGLFAARASAGKSMTSLLIALGLASGHGVLGRPVSPDAKRGVIYVSMEDDEGEFWRRLRHGIELMREDPRWTVDDEARLQSRLVPLFPDRCSGGDFQLKQQWERIGVEANAIPGGCGLIVLDTFARLSGGDENSAHETRPFLESQAALAQATGAAVMVIHHVGKGNDTTSDKPLFDRLHPEAIRGSSAIEASARFILTMAALSTKEADQVGLDMNDAQRGRFVALHLAKMSQGEKGDTLLLERRPEGTPGAGFLCPHHDGERILAAIQGSKATAKLILYQRVLMAIVEAGGNLKNMDQEAAAAELWPDNATPKRQWDKHLSGLRKKSLLCDPILTPAGWAEAIRLGFCSDRNTHAPIETEQTQSMIDVPAGTVETELMEQKKCDEPSEVFHCSTPLDERNGWNKSLETELMEQKKSDESSEVFRCPAPLGERNGWNKNNEPSSLLDGDAYEGAI